jgi:hypothetical protein
MSQASKCFDERERERERASDSHGQRESEREREMTAEYLGMSDRALYEPYVMVLTLIIVR